MTRTLFRGGSVFDGTGAPPAATDVVVERGTIVDVGIGLDGDEEVNLEGRTLLPGLFGVGTAGPALVAARHCIGRRWRSIGRQVVVGRPTRCRPTSRPKLQR